MDSLRRYLFFGLFPTVVNSSNIMPPVAQNTEYYVICEGIGSSIRLSHLPSKALMHSWTLLRYFAFNFYQENQMQLKKIGVSLRSSFLN